MCTRKHFKGHKTSLFEALLWLQDNGYIYGTIAAIQNKKKKSNKSLNNIV